MLSIATARKLKRAGMQWAPALHDFFAIPERGLDQFVFVISDMTIGVELLSGQPVVTFNGASEWALDYITATEVIWLPTEEQLRLAITTRLFSYPNTHLRLITQSEQQICDLVSPEIVVQFSGENACEAYAEALLYIINREKQNLAIFDQSSLNS